MKLEMIVSFAWVLSSARSFHPKYLSNFYFLAVSVYECSSNACLASGKRVLEGLVASLVHQVELCTSIDSGIETEEVIDQSRDFSLCAKCTSSIPKV